MPWLLEPENPSVRYWTLVDILEKPAAGAEVREAQRAIVQLPLVQEIFDRWVTLDVLRMLKRRDAVSLPNTI